MPKLFTLKVNRPLIEDYIRRMYVAFVCMSYAICLVCWALEGASISKAKAAQEAQAVENAQQIQSMKDKILEHDLKLTVDEANSLKLAENVNDMKLQMSLIQAKVDSVVSIGWWIVVTLAPIVAKEIMQVLKNIVPRAKNGS